MLYGRLPTSRSRAAVAQCGEVELEHVGFVDVQARRSLRSASRRWRIASRSISTACSSGSARQQRQGDRAEARTDLDHALVGLRIDRGHDPLDHAGIVQEVLAEAFARNVHAGS